MESAPAGSDVVANVAVPLLSVPVPKLVVPLRKVTVPPGNPYVEMVGATVAVKVTDAPVVVLALLEVRLVVVATAMPSTVPGCPAEALWPKVVSPA